MGRILRGGSIDARTDARLHYDGDNDARQDGEECGDGKPHKRGNCQGSGVGHLAQISHGSNNSGEDEWRDHHLEQLNVGAADAREQSGQPAWVIWVGIHAGGNEAQDKADDEARDDLSTESRGPAGKLGARRFLLRHKDSFENKNGQIGLFSRYCSVQLQHRSAYSFYVCRYKVRVVCRG